MSVHHQIGCGGFRIDLALVDPARPGRYLLGVECDGATYHSSATARDRDRLRQLVLEGLGWKICRVWSTDWVRDPGGQVARVLAAYARAREAIEQPSRAPEPRDPVEPEQPIPPRKPASTVWRSVSPLPVTGTSARSRPRRSGNC
jgi:very-short-patch-repair endonuclease